MFLDPALIASTLVLFILGTALGIWPVVKLIKVYEAKHELKTGSAGAIRTIGGWSVIAFWVAGVWFFATIIGDWGATGDLEGATARAWLRLRILLEILAAIASSD